VFSICSFPIHYFCFYLSLSVHSHVFLGVFLHSITMSYHLRSWQIFNLYKSCSISLFASFLPFLSYFLFVASVCDNLEILMGLSRAEVASLSRKIALNFFQILLSIICRDLSNISRVVSSAIKHPKQNNSKDQDWDTVLDCKYDIRQIRYSKCSRNWFFNIYEEYLKLIYHFTKYISARGGRGEKKFGKRFVIISLN
jgi:hypothetical protein